MCMCYQRQHNEDCCPSHVTPTYLTCRTKTSLTTAFLSISIFTAYFLQLRIPTCIHSPFINARLPAAQQLLSSYDNMVWPSTTTTTSSASLFHRIHRFITICYVQVITSTFLLPTVSLLISVAHILFLSYSVYTVAYSYTTIII